MKQSVLVLNANFEPIHICGMRRALGLILSEKATLVANGRGEIHSVGRSFPLPSVIRLQSMVHRPRQHVKLSRREVFRRDNYTCQYCGKRSTHMTIDHVIPRHMGGKHHWANVVTACSACNHRKGGRNLAEANMVLAKIPSEPPRSAYYVFGYRLREYSEWEPFLTGW